MWILQTSATLTPHELPLSLCFRASSRSSQPNSGTFRPSSSLSVSTTGTTNNYNPLIQSLCKRGHLKQALQLLPHERNPTQHTYELLILSCAKLNTVSDARRVHRSIVYNGFDQDPFLATKLINMYSELDCIGYARQVFDETFSKTVYVWNALFRALTLAGDGEEVLRLYRRMNRIGIPSDRFTYTYVLKACVASESLIWSLRTGKEVHAQVLRDGYENNVHIMTTLVDFYARFGQVANASYVFNLMPVKNVVSWSAMVACYAKNGMPFQALELFSQMMVESGDMLPNSVTMISVLQACASLAAMEQGKLIHGYILRKGLDSILPVTSALVAMYAKCGDLELARRVFDQMEKRNVVSWNSMISSYGIHGFGSKAVEVFQEMVSHGVSPTPVTFISVLGACSHSGLVEQGKSLFLSMMTDHGITPTVEHYACMVDLLGRANQLDEAAKIIQDMRIEPGAKVWGSLLGACRIHGNIELAERASRRLFKLEPKNAGNYVILADIYAEAGMWNEVTSLKKLIEEEGLQKVSGCSWIEVNRKVYSLSSVEELNPQIEQIHALLLKLSAEMKEKGGYVPETKAVLYDLDSVEKEQIVLGHSEKLAVAFGLINNSKGETIRITKNLRLCQDCHSFTKFVSSFTGREIIVRDVNRVHCFKDGLCSCADYW